MKSPIHRSNKRRNTQPVTVINDAVCIKFIYYLNEILNKYI